jgi:hypothetical protein
VTVTEKQQLQLRMRRRTGDERDHWAGEMSGFRWELLRRVAEVVGVLCANRQHQLRAVHAALFSQSTL